jgi:hypothetical protein
MRTRDEWRRVLVHCRRSRLSLRPFAAANAINWRTLQHWKYVLGKEDGSGSAASGQDAGEGLSFVEVRGAPVTADGRFEVEVAGRRVRVPATVGSHVVPRFTAVFSGSGPPVKQLRWGGRPGGCRGERLREGGSGAKVRGGGHGARACDPPDIGRPATAGTRAGLGRSVQLRHATALTSEE